MVFAKVKVRDVGTFECKDFDDLKKLVNSKSSLLKIKIEGIDSYE